MSCLIFSLLKYFTSNLSSVLFLPLLFAHLTSFNLSQNSLVPEVADHKSPTPSSLVATAPPKLS